MAQIDVAVDIRCRLGECPRWRAEEKALYFVDIALSRLHRWDGAELRTRQFGQPAGCFAFRRGGGLVLAMATGFHRLDDVSDPAPKPFGEQILAVDDELRFNDGRCDAQGRFWAGTVNTAKSKPNATLYRLGADGQIMPMANDGLTLNGVAMSPDGRTLYLADTPRHLIFAFDLDATSGALANRRVFHQFPQGEGRPDGGSVDAEGCYWSALYAGGRVVRLSPKGELLQEIALPVRRPTMIAFGGEDLKTAYVTSARLADDEEGSLDGAVLSFAVDTSGLPEADFAG